MHSTVQVWMPYLSSCTILLYDSQYSKCHIQNTCATILQGVEHYCIANPQALPPSLQTPEVNSLGYDASRGLVYAACGDWRTHVYDLETGKRTQTLEGHDDYVHDVVARWVCLVFFRSSQVSTGMVRVWFRIFALVWWRIINWVFSVRSSTLLGHVIT